MSLSVKEQERVDEFRDEFNIEDVFSEEEILEATGDMINKANWSDSIIDDFKEVIRGFFECDDLYDEEVLGEWVGDNMSITEVFRDNNIEEAALNLGLVNKEDGLENIFDVEEIEEFASSVLNMVNPSDIVDDLEED